jgi:hypothetical protein
MILEPASGPYVTMPSPRRLKVGDRGGCDSDRLEGPDAEGSEEAYSGSAALRS